MFDPVTGKTDGRLRRCIDTPPRADYVVESLSYAELARARLASAR